MRRTTSLSINDGSPAGWRARPGALEISAFAIVPSPKVQGIVTGFATSSLSLLIILALLGPVTG